MVRAVEFIRHCLYFFCTLLLSVLIFIPSHILLSCFFGFILLFSSQCFGGIFSSLIYNLSCLLINIFGDIYDPRSTAFAGSQKFWHEVLFCSLSYKFKTFSYKFLFNQSAAYLFVSRFADIWSFYKTLHLVLVSNVYWVIVGKQHVVFM